MTDTTQLITAAIGIIVACGAFAAWILRRMDRCFAEAKADTQRQFDEAKADTQRLTCFLTKMKRWRAFHDFGFHRVSK